MNLYRETIMPLSEQSGVYYRMRNLIERMAATDEPEEIAAFQLAIEEVGGDFSEHVTHTIEVARELEASCEAIDNEIERLTTLRDQREARAARLRDVVRDYMESLAIPEIATNLFTLRLKRNPPSVELYDELLIPDTFRRTVVKESTTIDKKAIAELLKAGVPVDGAKLVQKTRLEIK